MFKIINSNYLFQIHIKLLILVYLDIYLNPSN